MYSTFVSKSKKNLPWLTKEVVWAIRKRNMLFWKAKKCKSTAAFQKYRAARNKVVALIRLNKNKFFKKLGNSSQKEFWKAVKTMNNHESSFPTLQHNGTSIESSYDKAVLLNNFFFECFNKSVPPLSPDLPHLDPSLFPAELLCTEENILTLICSLDCTKSTGPDDISPRMLKGTASVIAPALTQLFNLSLSTGCFPEDW